MVASLPPYLKSYPLNKQLTKIFHYSLFTIH